MVKASFITVALMLLYAFPGYLLVKTKLVKKDSISAFAILLTYVCQPCLTVYAFDGINFTKKFITDTLCFFLLMIFILALMLAGAYLVMRKKQNEPKYRIAAIASAFGNFTFMGIPVVEALLPFSPEAKVYSTVAFLALSIFSWTVGSAIITHDRKYIKISKIFLNPGSISIAVAVILTAFSLKLPGSLASAVTLVGRMSTPVCMLVMGMRLGTMKPSSLFTRPSVYASIAVKQLLMPLVGLATVYFLPIDSTVKLTFYIMCCMPVASNVLNFAEMLGDGREEAANTVLLGTILSVLTMPFMMIFSGVL